MKFVTIYVKYAKTYALSGRRMVYSLLRVTSVNVYVLVWNL